MTRDALHSGAVFRSLRLRSAAAIGAWLLGVAGVGLATFAGCEDETNDPQPIEGLEDVIIEGGSTRVMVLLDKSPMEVDPEEASSFVAPTEGQEVPRATPFTFRWRTGTQARLDQVDPRFGLPPATISPPAFGALTPTPAPADPSLLRSLLSGVRSAHADSTRFTGTAYFLILATQEEPHFVRVLTDVAEYTPDEEVWQRFLDDDGPFSGCVMSAQFFQDMLVAGPWGGSWVAFTVEP